MATAEAKSLPKLRYPQGGAWPALMRSDMAAAFVDERSPARFLEKVKEGRYPPPVKAKGDLAKWRKADLEQMLEEKAEEERDVDALIEAALAQL